MHVCAQVETDKATMDMETPGEGYLAKNTSGTRHQRPASWKSKMADNFDEFSFFYRPSLLNLLTATVCHCGRGE